LLKHCNDSGLEAEPVLPLIAPALHVVATGAVARRARLRCRVVERIVPSGEVRLEPLGSSRNV